jgi:hypothetical protein
LRTEIPPTISAKLKREPRLQKEFSIFSKKKISIFLPLNGRLAKVVWRMVARFFLSQYTKTGENYQIDKNYQIAKKDQMAIHKYQMFVIYSKWP